MEIEPTKPTRAISWTQCNHIRKCNITVTTDDALEFVLAYTDFDVSTLQEIKVIRDQFYFICDGYEISVKPSLVFGHKHRLRPVYTKYNVAWVSDIIEKDRTIKLRIAYAYVEFDNGKNKLIITQRHVRVRVQNYYAYLSVKNKDGKWEELRCISVYNHTNRIDMAVYELLAQGLSIPAPPTKEELLKLGLPEPHKFDNTGRITTETSGWYRLKRGIISTVFVEAIVCINQDRTLRDAVGPSESEAWFQLSCYSNVRHTKFTVLSNGESFYIATKVGKNLKVVESTKINSYLDAKLTDMDQTMIKEIMACHVEKLELE